METVIPCSDDFRHPDGTVVTLRLLPHLFFGANGSSSYPERSPLRCHMCMLHFDAPPVFIPSSIQFHHTTGMTIEVTGHYCSTGCRNRALDSCFDSVQGETYRMMAVRADIEAFGRPLDYSITTPDPTRLEVFGGPLPMEALFQVRRETALTLDAVRAVAAHIRWVYRLRGVRETWYGKLEGGDGREAILGSLVSSEGSPAGPEGVWQPPALLHDPDALAARLEAQPGSPRLVLLGGKHVSTWPEPCGEMCWWCAGPVGAVPILVPHHRDLLNSVHLEGNFCTPGCGLSWLMAARRGLSPTRHHERVGLFVWMCSTLLDVPFKARPRTAPHFLEIDEFGGDLSRDEFRRIEQREDFHTSLEEPPAVSRRMLGNYTRPGVVCDLTRLGSHTSPVLMQEPSDAKSNTLPGMFDELVRQSVPSLPPPPARGVLGMGQAPG
jgi:hypothetical protein